MQRNLNGVALNMRKRNSPALLRILALIPALWAGNLAALEGDMIQPRFSIRYGWEDNVYRLSKDLDPRLFTGSSERGDTSTTTSIGLALNAPISRQRIQSDLGFNRTVYNQFTNRNFEGQYASVTWQWQLGNHWSGQLGETYSKSLTSTAAVLNPTTVQNVTPNPLTVKTDFFSADWLFHPDWKLHAGLGSISQRNGDFTQQVNDFNSDNVDVSLSYTSGKGNSIGLRDRIEQGRYPNPQVVVGSSAFDNAYTQHRKGVFANWQPGGHSRIGVSLDTIAREYRQVQSRNFTQGAAQLTFDWAPTGRFSLSAVALRDVSPLGTNSTSVVVTSGITLRPTYSLSGKLRLQGLVDYNTKDYTDVIAQVLGAAPARRDTNRTLGLTLSYAVSRNGVIMLAVQRESRTSTVQFADYDARSVFLSGQISF